ncbi:MAG TPA: NADPH-dependent F420 reductase [Methanothrix sp.]|nr:NADPH-dependent F420 reductase [Methanothrix sp.]HRW82903.1 NADPH-dependent F420 reductase [Methanothrix sp.]
MKIAVVGGTGDCGQGFIKRWAIEHEIIIGSRRAEKAEAAAAELTSFLKERGINARIEGMENGRAIEASEIVVLSVPYKFIESMTVDLKRSYTDQIVISPVVPMARVDKHFEYTPPAQGSAALLVKDLLPPSVRLVAGFHTISYAAFGDLDKRVEGDVLIAGDDPRAKEVVADLVRMVKDLRPLDGGPLKAAAQIEGLTPLLLNISRLNKVKNAGISVIEG